MTDLGASTADSLGGVYLEADQIHQGLVVVPVSFGPRTRESYRGFKPRPRFLGPVDDGTSIIP